MIKAMLRFSAAILLSAIAVNAQIPTPVTSSCLSNSGCKALLAKLTSSCSQDVSCLCTNEVFGDIKTCSQCDVASKVLDQSTADTELTTYINGCKEAGHPVSSANSLKISGFAVGAAALTGFILL